MPLPQLDPKDIPPPWMVVMLTLVFPGGAQLALGEKKRGALFVAVTVILMGLFFLVFALLVADFYGRMQTGQAQPTDMGGRLAQLGYVLLAGVVEAAVAAVDALALRRRIVAAKR
ncbi:MAG: hypothetical protein HQK87_07175 [Nitrospinae bacterium]|nr:hypothetical protein [Nitrospinota bacterium]